MEYIIYIQPGYTLTFHNVDLYLHSSRAQTSRRDTRIVNNNKCGILGSVAWEEQGNKGIDMCKQVLIVIY